MIVGLSFQTQNEDFLAETTGTHVQVMSARHPSLAMTRGMARESDISNNE